MQVDYEFLKKVVDARRDVGAWIANRPYTGLDVRDVESLVAGFDYLGNIIQQLTGENPVEFVQPAITGTTPTITITDGINE